MIRKLKELPLMSATLVLASVFMVGAFVVGCGSTDDAASAVETDDPGTQEPDTQGDDEDDHGDHSDEGSEASAESFGDVAAVWSEVTKLKTELDGIIAAEKLLDVHKAAFAIRDHVNMLADKSHDLSDGKQADLARGVRTVASLATELDETGDAEKQAETEALNVRLQTVLDAIADIYPEGALN